VVRRTNVRARQSRKKPGRRAGGQSSRGAILDAARSRFARQGYEATTIRAIAADAGVHTSLYEFALTCSQLLAGICNINGSNGPEPTYGGIDWPKAPPASSPAVTNKISQRTNVVVALE